MSETRKVVINRCYGGFGLSDAAYERLHEWGVPVRAYVEENRAPDTGLCLSQPANDGEVIFDRELTPVGTGGLSDLYHAHKGRGGLQRYWMADDLARDDARLVRLVEEMGEAANGPHAELKIVEIPADVSWEIDEYDGVERIAETHRVWS